MNSAHISKKIFLLVLVTLFSCSESDQFQGNEIFYNNDFESDDFDAIDGAQVMTFNNTTVLGNYNNDGFSLNLNNIGPHDYIYISFDLYIHDSWDGNFNNFDPDQPDAWFIELISDFDSAGGTPINVWETSFSNSVCNTAFCLRQSYPGVYPTDNSTARGVITITSGFMQLGV